MPVQQLYAAMLQYCLILHFHLLQLKLFLNVDIFFGNIFICLYKFITKNYNYLENNFVKFMSCKSTLLLNLLDVRHLVSSVDSYQVPAALADKEYKVLQHFTWISFLSNRMCCYIFIRLSFSELGKSYLFLLSELFCLPTSFVIRSISCTWYILLR